tara:strand:+ start:192 stop:644 length:453 start_codon:yes stop_codon:yes gene_type:complete
MRKLSALLLISLSSFAQEFSTDFTVRGCDSFYSKGSSHLLMEAVATSDKTLRVQFFYNGKAPLGFHMHSNPNKIFGIKDNILFHTGGNLMGQIVFSEEKKSHEFNFKLKNKYENLNHLEFNNAATRNLEFREDIIAVNAPQLKLCSWVKN